MIEMHWFWYLVVVMWSVLCGFGVGLLVAARSLDSLIKRAERLIDSSENPQRKQP